MSKNLIYFNIIISTNYDASLAENADVVVNMFNPVIHKEMENFADNLEKYNDDSRFFIDNDWINSINLRKDFKDFIKK